MRPRHREKTARLPWPNGSAENFRSPSPAERLRAEGLVESTRAEDRRQWKEGREVTTREVAAALVQAVEEALPRLRCIPDEASTDVRPGGRWCRREILGHLVDSAVNNQQRFVRVQEDAPLALPNYAQEHWVRSQGYADRSWGHLVPLWEALNRHLAHVLDRAPEEMASRRLVIGEQETTLGAVAESYVTHLRHHLDQILG